MSAVASVTFAFDGTDKEFDRLYEAIGDIDLDIAAYAKGSTGVIAFMISDFGTFEKQVAKKAAKLGITFVAFDYLLSEGKS